VRHHDALARGREQVGDPRNACLQRVRVGYAWARLGGYERAIDTLRSALSAARTFGLPAALALAQHNLGIALGRGATRPRDVDRLTGARDVEEAAALAYRAQGDGGCLAHPPERDRALALETCTLTLFTAEVSQVAPGDRRLRM
jgi:hypothetical protein